MENFEEIREKNGLFLEWNYYKTNAWFNTREHQCRVFFNENHGKYITEIWKIEDNYDSFLTYTSEHETWDEALKSAERWFNISSGKRYLFDFLKNKFDINKDDYIALVSKGDWNEDRDNALVALLQKAYKAGKKETIGCVMNKFSVIVDDLMETIRSEG